MDRISVHKQCTQWIFNGPLKPAILQKHLEDINKRISLFTFLVYWDSAQNLGRKLSSGREYNPLCHQVGKLGHLSSVVNCTTESTLGRVGFCSYPELS